MGNITKERILVFKSKTLNESLHYYPSLKDATERKNSRILFNNLHFNSRVKLVAYNELTKERILKTERDEYIVWSDSVCNHKNEYFQFDQIFINLEEELRIAKAWELYE